jgi:hypothetical protein
MSFIIETLYGATDKQGRMYNKYLDPFWTRKDADFWAGDNLDGTYDVIELTDPRSLRRRD